MKIRLYIGTVIFGLGLNLPSSLAADELWERAEQVVRGGSVWIPEAVETQQIVYDGKGKKQAENKIRLQISENPATGEIKGKLVEFLENEKDKTEKVRKEIEGELEEELINLDFDMPFHLENPSDAVRSRRADEKLVGEVSCVGYDFESTMESDDGSDPYRFAGTVWIDANTAVPLEIECHLLDLPRQEDGAEIVSLLFDRTYGYENGAFINLSEKQQLWVNAKLLFKKIVVYIEEETHYQNHWKWKDEI